MRTVAGESIILLRDRAGELRAFFNVCRHRGTRLCSVDAGQFSETIQCPYHAWTYSIDGRLLGAPHMQEVEGFDKRDYPLHAAALAEWAGFVFVNVADDPQPFDEWFAPMLTRLDRYNLGGLKVGHGARYDVAANWKLVFQNYSECMHCPMIHPELSTVLPYQSGANDLVEGPFLGGYMEITAPNESATLSGRACGRLVNDSLADEDRHRAFYYTIMPNLMLSIHPDYVNYYLLTPVVGRPNAGRIGMDVSSGQRRGRFVQPDGCDRILGRDQPARLEHRRAEPAWHFLAAVRARTVLTERKHPGGVGS